MDSDRSLPPPFPRLAGAREGALGRATRPGMSRLTGHVHWFHWDGEQPFGNGSLYRCRCGLVRHAV